MVKKAHTKSRRKRIILERKYRFKTLPFNENLERFAPSYTPETFTPKEQDYLNPFFSNLDKPVFVGRNLPEEVLGALSSRYSRSVHSIRRLFITEYVNPIVHPEQAKEWEAMDEEEKKQALEVKKMFEGFIRDYKKKGSIDDLVNIQRARKFFDTWLAQYGDDSIAELGGAHVFVEGISSVVFEEIINKRVGISPLAKSTRYVTFSNRRADGEYQYIVPGEVVGTKYENIYREAMDNLFETYSAISEPYKDYIKELYPIGKDETERSFDASRGAKRFDDIRDLLPFATQNNIALFGNGRAFEDLVNRLLNHPLGEARWWGQAICQELETVVPSFVRRPATERGAELQGYRSNINVLKDELTQEILGSNGKGDHMERWVSLVSYTPNAEIEILSDYLFAGSNNLSLAGIRSRVTSLSKNQRAQYLKKILEERSFGRDEPKREVDRFKKPPRAFENAHYLFEIWGRGGDYRDLHRHRQNTEEHQRFTTNWGYDLEKEVLESPFVDKIKSALEKSAQAYQQLLDISPDVAQYAVPFAYLQHWYMNLSAREIYWLVELRTGPQGRPHYREISQQIADRATEASPAIFQGLLTDYNDYGLARRESEKKIDRKLKQLKS